MYFKNWKNIGSDHLIWLRLKHLISEQNKSVSLIKYVKIPQNDFYEDRDISKVDHALYLKQETKRTKNNMAGSAGNRCALKVHKKYTFRQLHLSNSIMALTKELPQ